MIDDGYPDSDASINSNMTNNSYVQQHKESLNLLINKGTLYKRKDFIDKDEEAKEHPNRTYYYKKTVDFNLVIEQCTQKVRDRLSHCIRPK